MNMTEMNGNRHTSEAKLTIQRIYSKKLWEKEITFLKGCKESEMFRKAGLDVRDIGSRGTDEWYDDKKVVAQLPIKVTETLGHLVDERITQLTTHTHTQNCASDRQDKTWWMSNARKISDNIRLWNTLPANIRNTSSVDLSLPVEFSSFQWLTPDGHLSFHALYSACLLHTCWQCKVPLQRFVRDSVTVIICILNIF